MRMLTGEVYAVICSFLWAMSSSMTKSQATKMPVVILSALRTLPGLLVYWVLVPLSGRMHEFARITPRNWAFLGASTLAGLIVGDLMYYFTTEEILWGALVGCEGYVLIRWGEVAALMITGMS